LNKNLVYVGGSFSSPYRPVVFRSQDGGSSWTEISTGLVNNEVSALAVDPSTPSRIYAGMEWGGLFRTENGGASWTKMSSNGAEAIAVKKNAPAQLFIGGASGIFFSNDRGATWTDMSSGLTDKYVRCLAHDPVNDIIYVGTSSGGVFRNNTSMATLVLSATAGGTTNPAPGTMTYLMGTSVTITGQPDSGYRFSGWSGDASGTTNPLMVVMSSSKSITANFEPQLFAPQSFAGEKGVNRSGLLAENVIRLSWQNDPGNVNFAKSNLYLVDGGATILLSELSTTSTSYIHRKVDKSREYTYRLVAVNTQGKEGPAAQITVK
jgi:photosystem II stability/assembly factor-like uncharacterized protein